MISAARVRHAIIPSSDPAARPATCDLNRVGSDTLSPMQLTVNDAPLDLPDGATVVDLLTALQLPGTRVAVEVNRALVRRVEHANHRLSPGDRVEVVTLVGGG